MRSLPECLQWAEDGDRMYIEELGRSIFSDRQAFVNWTFWYMSGTSLEEIRDEIRKSEEWRNKHPNNPTPLPPPSNPLPVTPGKIIQVTDESDGPFHKRFYSYWSNAWINGEFAFVFVGHLDGSPRFFEVNLSTGNVKRMGSPLPYKGTGEGWCWDKQGWIYLCDGPRYRRVSPFDPEHLVIYDISETHPNCQLWQPHSSEDGQTHSATVQQIGGDEAWPKIGTVVFRRNQQEYFPAKGDLDESALTSDGEYLVIKETNQRDKPRLDNRIIHLKSRETRTLLDENGAIGHSDCGPGFIIGEADAPDPGCCCLWDLTQQLTLERRKVLFPTTNMGHISYRSGVCIGSDSQFINRVRLDGSGKIPLLEHNAGEGYEKQTGANLDPSGRVVCYMLNGIVYLLIL